MAYTLKNMLRSEREAFFAQDKKTEDKDDIKLHSLINKAKLAKLSYEAKYKELQYKELASKLVSKSKIKPLEDKLKKAEETIRLLKTAVEFDPDLVKVCDDWLNS